MKILCLPGAFGSAKNFKAQLGPFAAELERVGRASCVYTQGLFETEPPVGYEDYFGARPLYRFVNSKQSNDGRFDVMEGVRRMSVCPKGLTPEGTMRMLVRGEAVGNNGSMREALDAIHKLLAADADIQGILGYSEGAMMAASLILDEQKRWERQGIPRSIKFAIFFAGAPPYLCEGDQVHYLLADESDEVIDVPTCHVFGAADPYVHAAMAAYNLCDEDVAEIFDHGMGHLVPRDAPTVKELVHCIWQLITNKVQLSNG